MDFVRPPHPFYAPLLQRPAPKAAKQGGRLWKGRGGCFKKKKSPEMLGTKWNYCIWTKLLTERPFKIK